MQHIRSQRRRVTLTQVVIIPQAHSFKMVLDNLQSLVQGMLQKLLRADLEEARHPFLGAAIRSYNIRMSLMASHCVDTGHRFDLAVTRILNHANSWITRLFKEAWLSNTSTVTKCNDGLQQYTESLAGLSKPNPCVLLFLLVLTVTNYS